MGGDIALIVIGALCALSAAVFEGVRLPEWLRGGTLEPGRVLFQVLISTAFVLTGSAALDLTDGHPVWVRVSWIIAALFAAGLLYAIPETIKRRLSPRLSRSGRSPVR